MGLALSTEDGKLIVAIRRAGLGHAEWLAPGIRSILAEGGLRPAELALVVCAIGPGSFTGVRIGMSTAKGLAMGSGCAVVGVSNLDAVARRFSFHPGPVVPVLDARKGRLYAAVYRDGGRASEYLDLAPPELAERLEGESGSATVLLVGPHASWFKGELQSIGSRLQTVVAPGFTDTDPVALLEIGVERFRTDGADPDDLEPLYLRASEAELRSLPGRATPGGAGREPGAP
jgi:tRNA threonylcarbamoyladenosine biosynthesis protein TsaB